MTKEQLTVFVKKMGATCVWKDGRETQYRIDGGTLTQFKKLYKALSEGSSPEDYWVESDYRRAVFKTATIAYRKDRAQLLVTIY